MRFFRGAVPFAASSWRKTVRFALAVWKHFLVWSRFCVSRIWVLWSGCIALSPTADRLRRAFDRAYADKEEILTIRCSDGDVYDDMDEYLFEDGRVFRYLKGNGKARYVRNRDELTISFLLT